MTDWNTPKPTTYTPGELASALGVSVSTVKRWADQGRFPTRRTEGGHRRIPREAALALLERSGVDPSVLPGETPLATRRLDDEAGTLQQLLRQGREVEVTSRVLTMHRYGWDLANILHHGIAPALRQLGTLWQEGHGGIYAEHRATRIAERLVHTVRHQWLGDHATAPLAMGGAPPDDAHGLASAMAATVLEEAGWHVVDLGAYTPITVLADAARKQGAGLVWMALGGPDAPEVTYDRLASLRERLGQDPEDAVIVVGGPRVPEWSFQPPEGVVRVDTLPELRRLALSVISE